MMNGKLNSDSIYNSAFHCFTWFIKDFHKIKSNRKERCVKDKLCSVREATENVCGNPKSH